MTIKHTTNRREFLLKLPPICQTMAILPRHKIAIKAFFTKSAVWIVLLTNQPAQADSAWQLTYDDWRTINHKHYTRLRYVRELLKPTIRGKPNPPKPTQATLPF